MSVSVDPTTASPGGRNPRQPSVTSILRDLQTRLDALERILFGGNPISGLNFMFVDASGNTTNIIATLSINASGQPVWTVK